MQDLEKLINDLKAKGCTDEEIAAEFAKALPRTESLVYALLYPPFKLYAELALLQMGKAAVKILAGGFVDESICWEGVYSFLRCHPKHRIDILAKIVEEELVFCDHNLEIELAVIIYKEDQDRFYQLNRADILDAMRQGKMPLDDNLYSITRWQY